MRSHWLADAMDLAVMDAIAAAAESLRQSPVCATCAVDHESSATRTETYPVQSYWDPPGGGAYGGMPARRAYVESTTYRPRWWLRVSDMGARGHGLFLRRPSGRRRASTARAGHGGPHRRRRVLGPSVGQHEAHA